MAENDGTCRPQGAALPMSKSRHDVFQVAKAEGPPDILCTASNPLQSSGPCHPFHHTVDVVCPHLFPAQAVRAAQEADEAQV